MPTQAENAINRATEESEDGGTSSSVARIFYRNASSSGNRRAQFRVTPTEGGYFLEEALGAGQFWLPRAYALTEGGDGISADRIPEHVWAAREQRSGRLARALAKMREGGLDPDKEPLNYNEIDSSPDVDDATRAAVTEYRSLRWILVWPPKVVAEHIDAYREQWEEQAEVAQ